MRMQWLLLVSLIGFGCQQAPGPDGPSIATLIEASRWEIIKNIEPAEYEAPFVSVPPIIDGVLNDVAWQDADWTSEFGDIRGEGYPLPHLETRVKVIWDSTYVYLAARMVDDHLWAKVTDPKKAVWRDPDFEIFIDSDGDTHDYFEFEVNVIGTTNQVHFPRAYGDKAKSDRTSRFEGLLLGVHADGTVNDRRDSDAGWSVEVAFPWAVFKKTGTNGALPNQNQRWKMNFSRVHWDTIPDSLSDGYLKVEGQKKGTNWSWTPQGLIQMHIPELWGNVRFNHPSFGQPESDLGPTGRSCLFDTYYRQRAHFQITDSWAETLVHLFDQKELTTECRNLTMVADENGFLATYSDEKPGLSASIDHRRHFSVPATTVRTID